MAQEQKSFKLMDVVTTSFGKQQKVSVSRNLAIVLGLLFIGCLVATGLLVYHLTSCTIAQSVVEKVEICTRHMTEPIVSSTSSEEIVQSTTEPLLTHVQVLHSERPLDTPKTIDVRLPQTVEPILYDIKLVPYIFEGNFTFNGKIKISIHVTAETDNITLHADELSIDENSIKVVEVDSSNWNHSEDSGRSLTINGFREDIAKQFYIIYLDEKLEISKKYFVYIEFEGHLNDHLQGFYRSSYMVNNSTRWIAATQFQPTDARKSFPCFDEPALKAKFKLSLARPKNMSTISNMPRLTSTPFEGIDNYVWDHYEESIPMSTYLVAFVISDFEYITNGNFSVWARREALPQSKYSGEIGPQLLKFFEEFFQIKYPLPKVDMIALPDFAAGAMENWGLITYRESALLYEDGVSTRTSLQRVTTVIAHELAHQWFGNLVTPKWWTDLWLNEGFASYMEYLATDAVKPEWQVLDQFIVHELQNVLALDSLKTSHPISVKVNNPNEINDIFDRISYAKGATIIRMMEHFLSTKVFRAGLTNYLNDRKYGNADQDDLWYALTEEAHKNEVLSKDMSVKTIMDSWTLQTGFPVVFVTRSYEQNFVSFKQERYLLENLGNETALSLWWIPITFSTKKNNKVKVTWMRAEEEIILTDIDVTVNDWLLANMDQTGYYRVNYDEKNWQMLIDQLMLKDGYLRFSVKNRAQMVDDALNLAAAGYLDYEVALNLTRYLIHERECVPWMSAFMGLDYLQEMFITSAHFDKFKLYMLSLLEPLYSYVGFEDSYKDSQLRVYSRMEVLWRSCHLGNLNCVQNAVAHFYNWKTSPNPDVYNPIFPNLKNVVYCTAIRAGGQDEWDFAWQRYLNTNVGSEKEIIMSALGCSREIWILSRYLHWAIRDGSKIRKQDAVRVFAAVSHNVMGKDLVYRFFKTNWSKIKEYMGSSVMALNAIVKTCTGSFNTQEELDDLKTFYKLNKASLNIVARTLEQSIEQSEANIRWMNKNYHKIVRWLASYSKIKI